jgi:hypothetical protein
MGEPRLGSKDMRALRRRFRDGFAVAPAGSTKFFVTHRGHLVRDAGGRALMIANTPSSNGPHYMRRMESRLRREGVID